MTILIVDDEPAVRQAVGRALTLEHYIVQMAADGAEALAAIAAAQPDLVILDVLMPGIDGLDVARHLRGRGAPLPFLTRRLPMAHGLVMGPPYA